jgi:hypothetical protein
LFSAVPVGEGRSWLPICPGESWFIILAFSPEAGGQAAIDAIAKQMEANEHEA